jgi:uncharacterized protein YjiS (DUF1127 family)
VIARALARLRRWYENHAARCRLRQSVLLDRRFLEDIGLTAAEFAMVMQAPSWIAPVRQADAVRGLNQARRVKRSCPMEAIYRVAFPQVETRPAAGGPWDEALQHGSAPVALIAWATERIESAAPMRIARLTVDLLRPVPVAPLELRSMVLRQGRKIQRAQITLLAQGVEVVRASVLRLRCGSPPESGAAPLDVPTPDASCELPPDQRLPCPFLEGVAARLAQGQRPGPAAMWFRFLRPIVEGAATSPAMRAAMAGDFCNGVSSPLDFRQWSFVNADLSVSLARLPVGEWILVNAETWIGPDGGAIAAARLGDETGYFGRAVQTLLIERR